MAKNELHQAAADVNGLKKVKELIEEKGFDPNEQHSEFKTKPYAFAAQQGSLETLRYLIEEKKVSLDASDSAHNLLFWAKQNKNDPRVLSYVLDPRNELYKQFNDGTNEMHFAIMRGDVHGVLDIISKNPELIFALDNKGENALYYAGLLGDKKLQDVIESHEILQKNITENKLDSLYRGMLAREDDERKTLTDRTQRIQKCHDIIEHFNKIVMIDEEDYFYLIGAYTSLGVISHTDALKEDITEQEKKSHLDEANKYFAIVFKLHAEREKRELKERYKRLFHQNHAHFARICVTQNRIDDAVHHFFEAIQILNSSTTLHGDIQHEFITDYYLSLADIENSRQQTEMAYYYIAEAGKASKSISNLEKSRSLETQVNNKFNETSSRIALKEKAESYGLVCKDMPYGSRSFLQAISDQLVSRKISKFSKLNTYDLKHILLNHISSNFENYVHSVVGDLDFYIANALTGELMGDQVALYAASRALEVTIVVIDPVNNSSQIVKQKNALGTLFLGTDGHYQSLQGQLTSGKGIFLQNQIDSADVDQIKSLPFDLPNSVISNPEKFKPFDLSAKRKFDSVSNAEAQDKVSEKSSEDTTKKLRKEFSNLSIEPESLDSQLKLLSVNEINASNLDNANPNANSNPTQTWSLSPASFTLFSSNSPTPINNKKEEDEILSVKMQSLITHLFTTSINDAGSSSDNKTDAPSLSSRNPKL